MAFFAILFWQETSVKFETKFRISPPNNTPEIGMMKNKSHLSFWDELLEEEVAHKEQRRVEIALKISGLPFIKSIDEFDFTFQPKLDRQKVMSLFDLIFVQQKENVIFT